MFSPYSNENLIEENAANIAENVLFSFGDVENKSVSNPQKIEKKSAFANFANISLSDELPTIKASSIDTVINNYYKSPEFKGVSLYKPLGVNTENPLEKNVYSYSFSSATAVRGMAYPRVSGGIVNNPLTKAYNIVDNSYEFNRTIANDDFNDILNISKVKQEVESSRVEVTPIAANTFSMADILIETDSSQIIDFAAPKTMALTKITKMSAFWAKQRSMIENLKNMFIVKKEKIK